MPPSASPPPRRSTRSPSPGPGSRPSSRLRPVRCDYTTKSLFGYNIELTTGSARATYSPILAHLRGRLPETSRRRSGEWVLRSRLVTVGPGRLGTPPARHYDLAARSSLH